jgi:hypothetical protein
MRFNGWEEGWESEKKTPLSTSPLDTATDVIGEEKGTALRRRGVGEEERKRAVVEWQGEGRKESEGESFREASMERLLYVEPSSSSARDGEAKPALCEKPVRTIE